MKKTSLFRLVADFQSLLNKLLILAEIGHIGGDELFGPVAHGLQMAGEKAQGFGLVHKAQAPYQVAVVIEPLHPVDDVFRLGKGLLVQLDVKDFEADIWQQLIYHRNKWISRVLDTFIGYVCEHEFGR